MLAVPRKPGAEYFVAADERSCDARQEMRIDGAAQFQSQTNIVSCRITIGAVTPLHAALLPTGRSQLQYATGTILSEERHDRVLVLAERGYRFLPQGVRRSAENNIVSFNR